MKLKRFDVVDFLNSDEALVEYLNVALTVGAVRRPFAYCSPEFPKHPTVGTAGIELLVDTGADRTILSPIDAESMGLDAAPLDAGLKSRGIGGEISTRVVKSKLTIQGYSTSITLHVPDVRQPIPSLLGRDFMAKFALFMEERTGKVLFLDEEDLNAVSVVV